MEISILSEQEHKDIENRYMGVMGQGPPWWAPSSRGRLPARHSAPGGRSGTECVQRASEQEPTDRQPYDSLYKDVDIYTCKEEEKLYHIALIFLRSNFGK